MDRAVLSYSQQKREMAPSWRLFLTLTGVLISRATQEGFGLYFLAFTIWVLVGEAMNSLIGTPHMLRAPRLTGVAALRYNGSMLLHQFGLSAVVVVLLAFGAAIAFGLGHLDKALMLICTAATIFPVVLRNFVRNYCFAVRDVPSVLVLDIGVSLIQLGGIGLLFYLKELHHHWWLAILLVGVANLVSSLMWLSTARERFAPLLSRAIIHFIHNWRDSRFIFASSMIWWAGLQLYPWLVSGISGDHAAGIWGACFSLANLANPLVMGIQNYLAPQIAHAHHDRAPKEFRRYVYRSIIVFTLLVLPVCFLMALLADWLLTTINGPEYSGNGMVTAVIAFSVIGQTISFPVSRALFSLGRADVDFYANIGPLVVLMTIGVYLVQTHGVLGAAISYLVAQIVGCAWRLVVFSTVKATPASVRPSEGAAEAKQ
jgi:O-antigen/teichoic acid export membrane protein